MTDSILDSTKKNLGLAADYTVFDPDILMHINSILSVLNQLGVGPAVGFRVEDASATWTDFLGTDLNLNNVKTYVYLRVRILFDPPATGFHLSALTEQYKELEWRINVHREVELAATPTLPDPWDPTKVPTSPTYSPWDDTEYVYLDGGSAG